MNMSPFSYPDQYLTKLQGKVHYLHILDAISYLYLNFSFAIALIIYTIRPVLMSEFMTVF